MDNYQRDYKFISFTSGLCNECLRKIDAKIVQIGESIYIKKICPEHGQQTEILEEDAGFYLKRNEFDKSGTISKTQTAVKLGCPFDCGLCPSHDQHTCNGLIEVTGACDLGCPTCYANSGAGDHLPVETIDKMLDLFVESEYGSGEILQISGGEPTLHPQIIDIIKLARSKTIKYILLNTNGLRIARDEEFVKELSQFKGGFEIYLQFDGLTDRSVQPIRGKNVTSQKFKALENLAKYKIPITLVATIVKGVNDDQIGPIFEFALRQPLVRGINYQPVAFFGRLDRVDTENRITMTGILRSLKDQTKGMVKVSDFIPLPCDVERVAISYLFKQGEAFIPLIRNVDIKQFLPAIRNTFKFAPDDVMKEITESLAKNAQGCCQLAGLFGNLKKTIMPSNYLAMSSDQKADFINNNTFRISATSFIDKYNFDARSMQKECVHVITPDLKKIPFSAYNMIHRDKK